jgi:uncharacterized protein (DUF58 family)
MSDAFDANFLTAIAGLSLDVRRARAHPGAGVHLSPARAGVSLEFRDYQAYAPGDDLRRVDWNAYARTRHLFVRRSERPTAVPVVIAVDASRSMTCETPSRLRAARHLAAALASAAIASQNPVHLVMLSRPGWLAPRAYAGRAGFARLLGDVSGDDESDAPDASPAPGLADSLAAFHPWLATRPQAVLAIASDFLDPRGVDVLVSALAPLRQRLLLLQITQPVDEQPDLVGNLLLRDAESGTSQRVAIDAAALRRYADARNAYFASLHDFARARGHAVHPVDAALPVLPQLATIFPGGVLSI